MSKVMLINTMDEGESRMAIVNNGILTEFNIKMATREPTTGNIYKAKVQKVERGLRAAFVDYGGRKNGFLSLRDVSACYLDPEKKTLQPGQEIIVQVLREERDRKGAMLTTYVSLPGRYLVLMPYSSRSGISRKIEQESDRKRLMAIMEDITAKEELYFIVRTAGMNRTKQELQRDYQMLLRLWRDLQKKAEDEDAPTLIYQESDFAVRALRDFFTSDIREILVDDGDTYRKMRAYCKSIQPRSVRSIKLYRDETPIFDKFKIEDQIDTVYQERVNLKSGGSIVVEPTEALTTIDVNSGRGSSRKDVEETAYRTNIEAAEEIARQLRLRDLGGLIVIDFIDMMERKHINEVEKVFRNALSTDRARIQMSKISRFGLMEVSRQKKQSTIQEVSYTHCPHCKGRGVRPSVEYLALNAFRKIRTEAVKGNAAVLTITVPVEVSDYILNQKRGELSKIEEQYDVEIYVRGNFDMYWGEARFERVEKVAETAKDTPAEETVSQQTDESEPEKKGESNRKRRPRRRRRKPVNKQEQAKTVGTEVPNEKNTATSGEKSGIVDRILGVFR